MWKSHGFQQLFRGFEQCTNRLIFHFFDKNRCRYAGTFFVTETKKAASWKAVFAEKVGKNFFFVAGETLRVKRP